MLLTDSSKSFILNTDLAFINCCLHKLSLAQLRICSRHILCIWKVYITSAVMVFKYLNYLSLEWKKTTIHDETYET